MKLKVLIVEDELQKEESVIRILQKNEITHYCVKRSTEEAIEMTSQEVFDLLITDLKLPSYPNGVAKGKTGIEMMLALAQRNVLIPTIVYSTMPLSKSDEERLAKVNYPLIRQILDSELIQHLLISEGFITRKSD